MSLTSQRVDSQQRTVQRYLNFNDRITEVPDGFFSKVCPITVSGGRSTVTILNKYILPAG